MDKKTYETGLGIRTDVLGKDYVENALRTADEFNQPFQELVTEYCWGAVWGREGLSRKTRSMLNLAMIGALNRPHELKAHVAGALAQRRQQGRDPRGVHAACDLCGRAGRRRCVPRGARGVRARDREILKRTTRASEGRRWKSDSSGSARWAFTWPGG